MPIQKESLSKMYHQLMSHRVKNILIVSSSYDAFIMEEDGGLIEHVFMRYRGISLANPPRFTIATSSEDALTRIQEQDYDLVIIMPRYLGNEGVQLGGAIKSARPNLTVVLLVHHAKGLIQYSDQIADLNIDKIFVWSRNRNILWAVIKWYEDRLNAPSDVAVAMVRVLILVEDSPLYYSSLLPALYQSVVEQTQGVQEDGLNEEHRLLKLRARPKILLASNYEEAEAIYRRYQKNLLGLLTDTRFPRAGQPDDEAGPNLIRMIRQSHPDLPVLLLSSETSNQQKAQALEVEFLDKNSPALYSQLKDFFREYLGFGDFIFRNSQREEVARVKTLKAMEKILQTVPDDSIHYHASRDHFSNWFMARSQIELASQMRAVKFGDFASVNEVRDYLIRHIRQSRMQQERGMVINFKHESFDTESEFEFLKIGEGSLGGKARGLAFMSKILEREIAGLHDFKDVHVQIPKTLVLTTECYDQFINDNNLAYFSQVDLPDAMVASRFIEASLPESLEKDLKRFLENVRYPLAVRSSSILEDSQFEPYAGLYKTYMLPNNHPNFQERYRQLSRAIRLIYASVFYRDPKAFAKKSLHRTEEEKMAISIQQLIGHRHGNFFYPTLSGTVKSYNYYPISYMKAQEGIAHLAFGMGKMVVDGGNILRFSPAHPQLLPQFSSVETTLKNAQRSFYAVDLACEQMLQRELWIDDDVNLVLRNVVDALAEGEIAALLSTYHPQDHLIYDSWSSQTEGAPVLTFANLLKYDLLPLAPLLTKLLAAGKQGLGCDVEMEFALNMNTSSEPHGHHDFALLQIRPMIIPSENELKLNPEEVESAIIYSTNALGKVTPGMWIEDVVIVKPQTFSNLKTQMMVREINEINAHFEQSERKYLLVGPGRWGSSDSLLGIPVTWKDISNVAGIVEASLESFRVDPSQGTHFFQNITSLGVIYLTIYHEQDFLEWNFLLNQRVIFATEHVLHVRVQRPLIVKIDGNSHGIITLNS